MIPELSAWLSREQKAEPINHWQLLFPYFSRAHVKEFSQLSTTARRAQWSRIRAGRMDFPAGSGKRHRCWRSNTGSNTPWQGQALQGSVKPGNIRETLMETGPEPALRNPNVSWKSHRCTNPNQFQGDAGGGNFLLGSLHGMFYFLLLLPGHSISWLGIFGVEKLVFQEVFAPSVTQFRSGAIPSSPWRREVFKEKSLSIWHHSHIPIQISHQSSSHFSLHLIPVLLCFSFPPCSGFGFH